MLDSHDKRSRPRDSDADMSPEAKSRRLENLARLSGELVDRIASVNSDVIEKLLARWEHAAHDGITVRARASELESSLVRSKEQQVRAEINSAATTRALQHHVLLLDAMEAKLQSSASRAAETVIQQLDTLMTPSLRRTTAQLEKERDINNALAEKVHQFLGNCMKTLQISSKCCLDAEMQTAERDVTIARLSASLSFEQAVTLRHAQERETLLALLRALAERSKGTEQTRQELKRTKDHVRKLERYLDLNGIVAAISSAASSDESSADSDANAGASSAMAPLPPPPPSQALKLSAPHYFALRMLQHKDMTLSDLVDAWQRQENRINASETRYVELQEASKRLKEGASLVHQRYLEEKQRREITDRRLTEMVLERVEPDRALATHTEIARLRSNYAKVVEDASQLAVSLQVTKASLDDAQAKVADLEVQVAQLQTDAAADEVASTICALRQQYEMKIESLRGELMDALTERQLALTMAESRGRDQQRAQEALLLSRENNAEMSSALVDTLKRGPYTITPAEQAAAREETAESRAALLDMTNRALSVSEALESSRNRVAEEKQRGLDSFREQLAELTACFDSLTARPHAGAPSADMNAEGSHAVGEGTSPAAHLRQLQHQESMNVMKRVVQDALEFIAGHLETTEEQRNKLVDASISDAQYVSFLVDKLQRVTAERDSLRAELKRSHDLIEQNHLAVVEHALMHDVSVEDSLNAAEAAEQIESLRHQLEALQQSRDAALTDVNQSRVDTADAATRLSLVSREKGLLENQVKRLTDALHSSFTRESALHKRTIDLHGRLQALAESHAREADTANESNRDVQSHATLERLEEMATQVGEQLANCKNLLEERKEDEQKAAVASVARTVKALEEDLARCGLHKVATLLYEALSGSALLQAAVDTSVLQHRGRLATAALSADDLTPEMKTAELELRNRQMMEELTMLKQHRAEYENRLQNAVDAIGKSEAFTKRLLDLSNKLVGEKNKMSEKVSALQAEVDQLRAERPPPQEVAQTSSVDHGVSNMDPASASASETVNEPQVETDTTTFSNNDGGEDVVHSQQDEVLASGSQVEKTPSDTASE